MQVAPEQQSMKLCPEQADLMRQPKVSGNGCPCRCCGGPTGDIRIADIRKHGNKYTKWLQKPDGRIIEYYVYGSDAPDARIFLQINGSMGSAKFFSEMPSMIKVLEAQKVKAIAINIAGHGFTSLDPLRRMGEWPKTDVEPVFEAENVATDAPLIIEGSSFGASHAMAAMWHFQDRVTAVHFHVPPLSSEVAKELKLTKISEGLSCNGYYPQKCFLIPGHCCTPCLFCCCYCCFNLPCALSQIDGLKKLPGWDKIKEEHNFEASEVMKYANIAHSYAAGVHGVIYNSLLGQLFTEWGFHPFNDIKTNNIKRMKIMVTYGMKDNSSPTDHGEYMAKFYSEQCNAEGKLFQNVEPGEVAGNTEGGKCLVNVAEPPKGATGHEAHFVQFCKGDLLRKFMELASA